MGDFIQDGTGNSFGAKVDEEGRLHAEAIAKTQAEDASVIGTSFNINTGDIDLTSANESAVAYIKNGETRDLVITALVFLLGNSTNGAGDFNVKVLRNPTAGTIVSNATVVEVQSNKNYGSSLLLDNSTLYKGIEGATLTDGNVSFLSRVAGAGRPHIIATGDIILTRGASLGVLMTPQSANTTTNIQVAFATYLRKPIT